MVPGYLASQNKISLNLIRIRVSEFSCFFVWGQSDWN